VVVRLAVEVSGAGEGLARGWWAAAGGGGSGAESRWGL
jgi:hypothetical protein